MFLFPYRKPGLRFVDDIAAGIKGRATMLRGDPDPHGNFAELQMTNPVHQPRLDQTEFAPRLPEDAFSFRLCEHAVGLVLERSDGLAFVSIAHPALERHACT